MSFKLNTTTIKTPTKFSIQRYRLSKSGRIANGDMTMDIINKKRKFLLSYDVISGAELDAILDILDSDEAFCTFEYVHNGVTQTAVVYAGAIDETKFRSDGPWYWKDVSFDLIEK